MEEGVGLRDAGTVTPARYCIAYQDYASKIIDTEYILNPKIHSSKVLCHISRLWTQNTSKTPKVSTAKLQDTVPVMVIQIVTQIFGLKAT